MTTLTRYTRDLIQVLSGYGTLILLVIALSLGIATDSNASSEEDAKTVAALDTKYQAAVKSNDPATMDQILADDFVLVNGRGKAELVILPGGHMAIHSDPGRLATEVVRFIRSVECRTEEEQVAAVVSKRGA